MEVILHRDLLMAFLPNYSRLEYIMNNVYSVSQVNNYIKNMFSQDFALSKVYVKGEISNCKYHTSGHIYFTLKDKGGVIPGVMFAGNRRGLNFRLEEGQNVVVLGSINIYEKDGRYQIYAKEIILEGAGFLYQKFEQLKEELSQMGMFDEMYKKPIPKYALNIGVCTASTGAAIQDIINISKRRNPYVQLYLYPTLVQGENAAANIVHGIRCLDSMNLDIIIVGRGGGSIEDLWAFNEEIVARAIFSCNTPIISAVGHETDTTIADYVADLRAPTPSAAAELAVFDYMEFSNRLSGVKMMLNKELNSRIERNKLYLKRYEDRLSYLSPSNQILTKRQYVNDLSVKMENIMEDKLLDRKHRLAMYAERLKGNSPLNRISKGFAYVTDIQGKQIHSVGQLEQGKEVHLTLKDGKAVADIKKIEKVNLSGVSNHE